MNSGIFLGLLVFSLFIITIMAGFRMYIYKEPIKEVKEIKLNVDYQKVLQLEPISSQNEWVYQFNNNPINIKKLKANDWLGSVKGSQGKFEEFIHPSFGIRASIKVILANIRNTETVRAFVYRIAMDNDDEAYRKHIKNYVRYLELELGYKGKIREKDVVKVLRAMIFLEGGNGAVAYFSKYMECKQLEKFI